MTNVSSATYIRASYAYDDLTNTGRVRSYNALLGFLNGAVGVYAIAKVEDDGLIAAEACDVFFTAATSNAPRKEVCGASVLQDS